MKIRVVSTKKEIDEISSNEKIIHLAFRASNIDIFRLMENCPMIRAIQLPASYRRTLSKASEMFLQMQGVSIIEGDVWGHRKDISDYYNISDHAYNRMLQLSSQGLGAEEIAEEVAEEIKISPNLVRYVLSQAS
ncbi:MAG: DUF1699 family protein [Methanosarcinales archaeon]|nr:DUF1699 family protein [Methanosarcinales archaeon]